ncbi:MAG TPA: FeoA family protein [Myxococcota bacterium]|nr:FeoA family protein [Myxococcota bacterium]
MTLARLPVGASARVTAIDDASPVASRLHDLGFVPGTAVRSIRRAPLGDPTLYEVRGAQLCLRRSEAEHVLVDAIQAAPR